MSDIAITQYTEQLGASRREELLDAYMEVYSVPPYEGDPFFSRSAAKQRLDGAVAMDGFTCVTAHDEDALAGFVYGVAMTYDKPWWERNSLQMPNALHDAIASNRVFWLRELLVRQPWRGRGVGRILHDALTQMRSEPEIVLTCIPDNEPAHTAYTRWGYQSVGLIQHTDESPWYDAMVLKK